MQLKKYMESQLEFEIGVVEYRNIIKVIKDTYDYDFSDYTLISLKRRFERFLQTHNLRHPDTLIDRLREDKLFFEAFLSEIAIETTEMFRDPSFWRYMRDELMPTLLNENFKLKIWFPSCVSGEELYTLQIVLKEQNWESQTEVVATCLTNSIIEHIQNGVFAFSKIDTSADNYERYSGASKFINYYSVKGDKAIRDSSLIKNVRFIKQNINFDNSPQDVKLVICRNQLIYYTQNLHDKVLKIFNDSLLPGGYLALGAREQVGTISSRFFRIINEAESIYKRI